WREAHRRIPNTIPATIRTAGLDYDLIDDDALTATAPDRYRVVIIPAATMIMEATANWLSEVISAGGSVIMIDSTYKYPVRSLLRLRAWLTHSVRPSHPISRSRRRRRTSALYTVATETRSFA
ncbi:MAG TPA: hypothetical protein VFY56_10800, partial [Propionibacteriaceae bacterium]|nr:hypothetical protein [Propionibacteriaceae bacterium]